MRVRLSVVVAFVSVSLAGQAEAASAWRGYGGDAQHNANAPAASQAMAHLHWTLPVDLHPPGFLGIHYGSPMITAANTVLVPVKTTFGGSFRIEAHDGASGALLWQKDSKYVLPPHDWIPSFPAHLTPQNRLYFAGPGGTVQYRDDPDAASGAKGRVVFYGHANYMADRNIYNTRVMVSTPITADDKGNIYFGFLVTGSTPLNLKSGIARVDHRGQGVWIAAGDAASDQGMTEVAQNCAPAVSLDGKTIYVAVSDGGQGYLVGLDSKTLQPKYRAQLIDPHSMTRAILFDDSSASPTVGPDGDVYYGVVEYDFSSHNDRGWLLHFDAKLEKVKTPGSFGWDDTVSVVPASAVPSYAGTSTYLLMSKYNNYYGIGNGDGHNKIAILDPNAKESDPIIPSVKVMNEVMTIVGPTHVPGEPQGVVYEWCINSAVVDPATSSVIAGSEDGHAYRWDLTTNTLSQSLNLNQPTGEAYTPSLVGPDGTIYSINNARLYAIGN